MPAWRKLSVGPLRKVKCKNCRCLLRVAWFPAAIILLISSLLPIGGLLAVAAAGGFSSLWAMAIVFFVVCGVAMLISAWIYHRYVPFKVA